MPDWLTSFLTGINVQVACAIWNAAMKAVSGLITRDPQTFSPDTWAFVEGTVYPFMLSIGLSLLNLFFIIGFLRALTHLHENITLEYLVETLIKVVVANVLFLNMKKMILSLFSIASLMAGSVFTLKAPTLVTKDMDLGAVLFYHLFGTIFILTAIVCSMIIILTVYSRYIKLYLLVVCAPFAVPTLVGGQEAQRTFYSYLRSLILNIFEIVLIALVMVICFKLTSAGVHLFTAKNIVEKVTDGFVDTLNALLTMVIMTASVKGVNSFMAKTFGL